MAGDPALVLASGSPRRRELIRVLGVSHLVHPVEIDESPRPGEDPQAYVTRLARGKADAGAADHPGRWVLGADTTVVLDETIIGKPTSPADAERILARLCGRCHHVMTAVALRRSEELHERCDVTAVWLRALDRETIRAYVATGEPLDKAGAYAAQGVGATIVDRIEGDYFGVIGFPLRLVTEMLTAARIPYCLTR